MSLSMRGQTAELRYGYQVAARLGAWSLDGSGRVDATSIETNELWLDSGPLALWLRVGSKAWVWTDVVVAESGPTFVVRVTGSPDVRDVR